MIAFSKYPHTKSQDKVDITLEEYVKSIKDGEYQEERAKY